jgi:hypothetical protein
MKTTNNTNGMKQSMLRNLIKGVRFFVTEKIFTNGEFILLSKLLNKKNIETIKQLQDEKHISQGIIRLYDKQKSEIESITSTKYSYSIDEYVLRNTEKIIKCEFTHYKTEEKGKIVLICKHNDHFMGINKKYYDMSIKLDLQLYTIPEERIFFMTDQYNQYVGFICPYKLPEDNNLHDYNTIDTLEKDIEEQEQKKKENKEQTKQSKIEVLAIENDNFIRRKKSLTKLKYVLIENESNYIYDITTYKNVLNSSIAENVYISKNRFKQEQKVDVYINYGKFGIIEIPLKIDINTHIEILNFNVLTEKEDDIENLKSLMLFYELENKKGLCKELKSIIEEHTEEPTEEPQQQETTTPSQEEDRHQQQQIKVLKIYDNIHINSTCQVVNIKDYTDTIKEYNLSLYHCYDSKNENNSHFNIDITHKQDNTKNTDIKSKYSIKLDTNNVIEAQEQFKTLINSENESILLLYIDNFENGITTTEEHITAPTTAPTEQTAPTATNDIKRTVLRYDKTGNKVINRKESVLTMSKLAYMNNIELSSDDNKLLNKICILKNEYDNRYNDDDCFKVYLDYDFTLYPIQDYVRESEIEGSIRKYTNELKPRIQELLNFDYMKNLIINSGYIRKIDQDFMYLAGEDITEYAKEINEKIRQEQDEKIRQEEEEQKKKEEEFLQEQEQEKETLVSNAIEALKHDQYVKNEEIRIYINRYEYTETTLFNLLFKRYNIKIPLKVQGWINVNLVSMNYMNEKGRYQMLTKSKTFSNYYSELIDKIKEEQIKENITETKKQVEQYLKDNNFKEEEKNISNSINSLFSFNTEEEKEKVFHCFTKKISNDIEFNVSIMDYEDFLQGEKTYVIIEILDNTGYKKESLAYFEEEISIDQLINEIENIKNEYEIKYNTMISKENTPDTKDHITAPAEAPTKALPEARIQSTIPATTTPTPAETPTETPRIKTVLKTDFNNKIEKSINRMINKFQKYNINYTYNIIGERVQPVKFEWYNSFFGRYESEENLTEVIDLQFEFDPLVLGDFEIVAILENIAMLDDTPVNNIYVQSEEYTITELKNYVNSCSCEHCNSNRKRKHTFILKDRNTNKLIQIGKTCVRDYTNFYNTNDFLSIYESMATYQFLSDNNTVQMDEELYKSMYKDNKYIGTKLYLINCIALIDNEGYQKGNTKENAFIGCQNFGVNITDSHRSKAEKVMEYFDQLETDNNFELNIKNALSVEYSKESGFVAYAYELYKRKIEEEEIRIQKEQQRQKQQQEQNEKNDTLEYVGSIGDTIETTVKLISIYQSEFCYSAYNSNTTYIYTFIDSQANIYTWSTSKQLKEEGVFKGYELKIKGKIKDHKEYRGQKQTVLTRCKVSPYNDLDWHITNLDQAEDLQKMYDDILYFIEWGLTQKIKDYEDSEKIRKEYKSKLNKVYKAIQNETKEQEETDTEIINQFIDNCNSDTDPDSAPTEPPTEEPQQKEKTTNEQQIKTTKDEYIIQQFYKELEIYKINITAIADHQTQDDPQHQHQQKETYVYSVTHSDNVTDYLTQSDIDELTRDYINHITADTVPPEPPQETEQDINQ